MSRWTGKPCGTCGGTKGPKHADRKDCHRCTPAAKRAVSDRAHRQRVAARYGIKPGDYDAMYAAQDGRCALCRRATGKTRRLSVDHNHKTTEVRGLLCRPCNDILGHAHDDPEYFARAILYLTDPPARAVLSGES